MYFGVIYVEDEEGWIIGLDKFFKYKRIVLVKIFFLIFGMVVRGMNVDGGRLVGKIVYRYLWDGDVLFVNC